MDALVKAGGEASGNALVKAEGSLNDGLFPKIKDPKRTQLEVGKENLRPTRWVVDLYFLPFLFWVACNRIAKLYG